MRYGFAVMVLAVTVVGSATSALASDRWTQPYAGVRHLHRRGGGVDFHVVTVDLRNPRVHIVSTPESATMPTEDRSSDSDRGTRGYRWTATSQFARNVGADIAVNANYFDIFHRQSSTCGLTMSHGQVWQSAYPDARLDCFDSVGFGSQGRAQVFDSRDRLFGPAPVAWMSDVVTGSPRLLRDGKVVTYHHPRHALQPNPRTAIGLSRDRSTLFLIVVNGREGHAVGMTCPAVARVLHELGAWDAVNLDGGGSSALYIRREGGIVSHLADGSERAVGNHLGIVFGDPAPSIGPESVEPGHSQLAASTLQAAPRPGTVVLRAARASWSGIPHPAVGPAWRALIAAALVVLIARGALGIYTRRPNGDPDLGA